MTHEQGEALPTPGIIGSGNIGTAVARLAVVAGIDVVIANLRGPQSLTDLIDELGSRASAGTVEQVAGSGEATLLSIPMTAYGSLPDGLLRGRTVLDTGNYYPHRDGHIAELDPETVTTTEWAQQSLPGAPLVKAFNNILAHHIPQLARPAAASDRSALPIAGGDPGAKARAARLIDRLKTAGLHGHKYAIDAVLAAVAVRTAERGLEVTVFTSDVDDMGKFPAGHRIRVERV